MFTSLLFLSGNEYTNTQQVAARPNLPGQSIVNLHNLPIMMRVCFYCLSPLI